MPIREEIFAERSEFHAVTATLEQSRAERFFQHGDLFAERGLAQMQCVGGAAEMAHFHNGQKRTK